MEKRFWLGVGILIVLLAAALGTTVLMRQLHEPASELFRQAAEQALTGDLDGAVEKSQQAALQWQTGRTFTACVADHSPMDQVEDLLSEMTVFAQAEDAEHFAAACARLAVAIKAMSDAHSPAWWNFL